MTIPNMYTTQDVASIIKLSEQQVRVLLRKKEMKGQQIGKQWIVTKAELLEYCTKNKIITDLSKSPKKRALPKIKALSFFSGAMGLDQGLIQAGIPISFVCENDKACQQTISNNHSDLPLMGDIWKHSADDIRLFSGIKPSDKIDIMVGGPPCQSFSTAGARKGFKDERGNALLRYVDLILEFKPTYAVIENVRGLLSAPMSHRPHSERGDDSPLLSREEKRGGALLYVLNQLKQNGYKVSFNLYNAANFGVPQTRERVVIICCLGDEKVPHLMPTHSQDGSFNLPKWVTLRDALKGLDNVEHESVTFPEKRLFYYKMLKAGQYWKHLPEALQKEAMGKSYYSGGGKTGFLRRLSWDKPSCTLVTTPNMPATDICHPELNRPLSVQEYKRIQQFPDDYEVCGSTKDKYKQIGNAVPVGLGVAIGKAILNHMNGKVIEPPKGFKFSRYKDTDEVSWERKTRIDLEIDSDDQEDSFLRAAR